MSNIKQSTLDNGLRVLTVAMDGRHTSTVGIFVNTGSRNETVEQSGLSHFLEHMIFKGTKTRNAREISGEVEIYGSMMNAFTSMNTTAYFVSGLSTASEMSLSILADILTSSVYDEEEIAREQDVVCQEISEYEDDAPWLAYWNFLGTAFADQAAGRPIIGTKENVRSFTRNDLISHVRKHYEAGNIIIAASGDVDHDQFVQWIQQTELVNLPASEQTIPAPSNYVGSHRVSVDERFDQAQVYIGFPAPKQSAHDFGVYEVLAEALGGGMSSPLFYEARERRGLCYTVSSMVLADPSQSMFSINAATSDDQVVEFIKVAGEQLKLIADGGLEESDYIRALNTKKFSLASLDHSEFGILRAFTNDVFETGKVVPTSERLEKYDNITAEDVINAAKTLIQTNPTISLTGKVTPKYYADDLLATLR